MNENELAAGLPATANYRYAKRVGGRLFVSGQVPLDQDRQVIGVDDPAGQARQCLSNLQLLLGVHEFGEQDIQQLVVYVVGERANLVDAWGAVENWFDNAVPPATLLGVSSLGHKHQLVEIDATIERDHDVQ